MKTEKIWQIRLWESGTLGIIFLEYRGLRSARRLGTGKQTWYELNIEITENLVYKKLEKLRISKSPGPDGMHPRVLKEMKHRLVRPLTLIFQNSLRLTTLPSAWREANFTAIYKKGNKKTVSNYRPVSLTCVVCKLMEMLLLITCKKILL